MMSRAKTYTDILQKAHDLFKEEIQQLTLLPYAKALKELKGKAAVQGLYLIFDEEGVPFYVGKGESVHVRLRYHVSPQGDFVEIALRHEGFEQKEPRAHRCDCGRLLKCQEGAEKIDDGRLAAIKKIQSRILSKFKVAILPYDNPTGELPLGLRELERLVQYVMVPSVGGFPHPKRGWITIAEHVADNPITKDSLIEKKT